MAWTALVVALLALILGWTAFNRAGADIGDIVEQEVREATQEMEQKYQEAEVRTRANVSEELNEAAQDASTDTDPGTVGD